MSDGNLVSRETFSRQQRTLYGVSSDSDQFLSLVCMEPMLILDKDNEQKSREVNA